MGVYGRGGGYMIAVGGAAEQDRGRGGAGGLQGAGRGA